VVVAPAELSAARVEDVLHEDPLTGLFNRRYVLTRLAGLISAARRHGRPLSVATIDIDHFKPLNDEYGHDAGDVALVAITSTLRERLRGSVEEVRARCGPHELTANGQRRVGHLGQRGERRSARQTSRHRALLRQGFRP
jgi:diguanylate cyclase (GGDEF)-like protein